MKEPECLQQVDSLHVMRGRKKLLYFAGCDYHRLASHPAVKQAAEEGLRSLGLNVAASRLTTGNHPIYPKLERRLAEFFGFPTASLLSNGYAAPIAAAQALHGEFSHAFIDERSHACLFDALSFLGCPSSSFPHRDPQGLQFALETSKAKARAILITDGMFSHDGSVAPLADYRKVLPQGSTILVDDSHGAGVIGKNGRGTLDFYGLPKANTVVTMTLSKAFGSYGGAVLGPKSLREKVLSRARIFIGNTPLPLPLACASLKSLEVFEPKLTRTILENGARVKNALRGAGVMVADTPGPIVSLLPETPRFNHQLNRALLEGGIYPSLIRYMNKSLKPYFRFVISSQHSNQHLERLIGVLQHVPAIQEKTRLWSERR